VLLVPHLGSGTTETRTAMADLAAENVLAVLDGASAADADPQIGTSGRLW
jgi:lactate dehydrogenase-like 2-hydroxyacid dehydrogenase